MALLWHGKRHWQQWEVLGRSSSQVQGTYLIWKTERGWNTKLKTGDWFLKSLFGFQFFMRITQTLVSCLLSCLIIDGSAYHIHLIFSKFILAREGRTPWICPEDALFSKRKQPAGLQAEKRRAGWIRAKCWASAGHRSSVQGEMQQHKTCFRTAFVGAAAKKGNLTRTLMRSVVPLKYHIHSRPESRCCFFF